MSNSIKFSGSSGPVSSGDIVFIESQTASNSATIEFTDLDSTYFEYLVVMTNVVPTSSSTLHFKTSSNNGSSYDSGATDYSYDGFGGTSTGAAFIVVTPSVDTDATAGISAEVRIYNPSSTNFTKIVFAGASHSSTNLPTRIAQSGQRESAAAVDAIQFLFSTGNISTGDFYLYGVVPS
jgi:hypothetical protein